MNNRRVRVQKSFFRKGTLGCARHSTRPKQQPSAYANIFFSPPEHSSIGELDLKDLRVDLNKQLKSRFANRNRIYPVEHEGLDVICFSCRKYGHKAESCQVPESPDSVVPGNNAGPTSSSPPPEREEKQPLFSVPGVSCEEKLPYLVPYPCIKLGERKGLKTNVVHGARENLCCTEGSTLKSPDQPSSEVRAELVTAAPINRSDT